MSEVTRWTPSLAWRGHPDGCTPDIAWDEDHDGPWVRWDDYAALAARVAELEGAIRHVEADLMGNADERTRGTFTLIETQRIDALFAALGPNP